MYLYRVTVIGDVWNNFSRKSFYVMSRNKEEAKDILSGKLKEGFKISSVAFLGEQIAGSIFAGKLR